MSFRSDFQFDEIYKLIENEKIRFIKLDLMRKKTARYNFALRTQYNNFNLKIIYFILLDTLLG